ncbi:DUF1697 domain-containing protein [Arenibacter sp. BSSL-BM3]|uniref:DUF1697 domain-containing protein n=1 Tax=Arenibacter arenosicollis TaxID=2762274 RepID=A0ABR7QH90_9FLAO|nr:DUF1697 domain-containing protein [Arenibacter arenosicollis]MBC8766555.1 DUF1697 domain-containing protein [Arenibacter arenosicollis]
MTTYIILLRGINVGGQKKIIMSNLRTMLQDLNFAMVRTYIQSGNIVLKSDVTSPTAVSQIIKDGIYTTFGFDVPVLAKTFNELKEIIEESPFEKHNDLETKKWYYVLLQEAPKKELVHGLQQEQFPNERFVITNNCVYLSCDQGYGNTKCNNNFFEKRLEVPATTRNHRTIMKLLEMAEKI